MVNGKRPVNQHDAYHAHVYFGPDTLDFATKLCQQAGKTFSLAVGRAHQKPVGPHTMWSCQILFTKDDFDSFIPWLDSHRGSLSVLIHADTGDDRADHTTYAYWLGDVVELDLRGF
ncbi:DOPA 4,5-dioxygenase family protein [Vibrio sp. ZSDZ34]|jgi:DOPA 4,5-dioxygenase|uniref:DOPA 4,5-dioxygenase family protein n=1 Tax=Vibrio gelatinilyticus TaxID=2893468 RepID=A0A9X2AYI7_9VIBR|nr:DOPA 4,5-dioxygenase family protein [Vibrio gelatinilyticus]MCJ2376722.1 DOPA 4,5-dioxygenase family protein [Vibrio gelatinilyticus]